MCILGRPDGDVSVCGWGGVARAGGCGSDEAERQGVQAPIFVGGVKDQSSGRIEGERVGS